MAEQDTTRYSRPIHLKEGQVDVDPISRIGIKVLGFGVVSKTPTITVEVTAPETGQTRTVTIENDGELHEKFRGADYSVEFHEIDPSKKTCLALYTAC